MTGFPLRRAILAGVFASATVVPMIAPIPSTAQYDPARLDVHFYADESVAQSFGQFYDDDGRTPDAVAKKQYELLRFRSERVGDGFALRLDGERHDYPGRPDAREIRFVVHGLAEPPARVAVDGREIPVDWRDGLLAVAVDWTGAPRTVAVD